MFSNFYGLMIWFIAILSLFLFDLQKGLRSISLYLPIAAGEFFLLNEMAVRAELPSESVPIRIDLLINRPLLTFVFGVGITRWALVVLIKAKKFPDNVKSGRLLQLMSIVILGSICGTWLWKNWW